MASRGQRETAPRERWTACASRRVRTKKIHHPARSLRLADSLQPTMSRLLGPCCAWVHGRQEEARDRDQAQIYRWPPKFKSVRLPSGATLHRVKKVLNAMTQYITKELDAPTKCTPTLRSASSSVGDRSSPSRVAATSMPVHVEQLGHRATHFGVAKGRNLPLSAARSHQPPEERRQTAACSKKVFPPWNS